MAAQDNSDTLHQLFESCRRRFPIRYQQDSWYLCMVAALIGSGQHARVGALYQHIIETGRLETSEERKAMMRRLREAMTKCVILHGIPKVLLAFQSLASVELEQDRDPSITRQGWKPDEENHERAVRTLRTLYRGNEDEIYATISAHPEIVWISNDISYGLFLSDHRILDIAETELVILPGVISQDLQGPSLWHMKASLRIGFSREEVEAVHQIAEEIVVYGGGRLQNVGSVWDVGDI